MRWAGLVMSEYIDTSIYRCTFYQYELNVFTFFRYTWLDYKTSLSLAFLFDSKALFCTVNEYHAVGCIRCQFYELFLASCVVLCQVNAFWWVLWRISIQADSLVSAGGRLSYLAPLSWPRPRPREKPLGLHMMCFKKRFSVTIITSFKLKYLFVDIANDLKLRRVEESSTNLDDSFPILFGILFRNIQT